MNITWEKPALKALIKMQKPMVLNIRERVLKLPGGDVKQLENCYNKYRLRVGSYRVIFEYTDNITINILGVLPRGSAYKSINMK